MLGWYEPLRYVPEEAAGVRFSEPLSLTGDRIEPG